jgi:uncharacterized protein YbjT (DUF2867 family)
MYLVTGAGGNAGRAVVDSLIELELPVRALVRSARPAPAGVEVVVGDLNRPDGFAEALDGVRGIFLLAGYEGERALLERARAAGTERVVLLSSSAAPSGRRENAVARYHIDSEAAVRDSGLAWTVLQPNSFMTNTLAWADRIRAGEPVRAPFSDVAVATIDPADIGAVAARALAGEDGLAGRALRLSGPDPLTPAERGRILAEVLGRAVRVEPQPDDEARAEMLAQMPEPYVDAFFEFFRDGLIDETTVHPTVERVLRRSPRSFRDWAAAHAGAFAG